MKSIIETRVQQSEAKLDLSRNEGKSTLNSGASPKSSLLRLEFSRAY